MPKIKKPRLTKTKGLRRKTSPTVEATVLKKSRRRCALCFHLQEDLTEKYGQIAHLDNDRTNNAERNLVYLCMEHHSLFDSKTSQHKNYTHNEVRSSRDELYKIIAKGILRLTRRTRTAKDRSSADRSHAAKQRRWFAMREFVSSFPSPRIVPTHAVVEHLREKLPKDAKGMSQDQLKMELYELEGTGVLKYHSEVDAWSLGAGRDEPARWKRY